MTSRCNRALRRRFFRGPPRAGPVCAGPGLRAGRAALAAAVARLSAAALLAMLGGLGVAGCSGDDGVRLAVDVRTDYAPGVDFDAVRYALNGPRTAADQRDARAGDRFGAGVRVGEVPALPEGRYGLRVELLSRGVIRATRRVEVSLREGAPVFSVLVLFTRSCEGVVCPRAGDRAEATECLGGACLSPRCEGGELAADLCVASECVGPADCPPVAACATRGCVRGACIPQAIEGACGAGTYCALSAPAGSPGCEPLPDADAGPPDAGAPDAGPLDGGPPDAGPPDAGPPPFVLPYLPTGATAWTTRAIAGDGPRREVRALVAHGARAELVLLTDADAYFFSPVERRFLAHVGRDTLFPELAGATVLEGVTIGGDVTLYTGDAAYTYRWAGTDRTALARGSSPRDWSGPLAPSDFMIQAVFHMPDNALGWADADVTALCGRRDVRAYTAFVTFNGIGPGRPTAAIFDTACARFVQRLDYPDFGPFRAMGAPSASSVVAGESFIDDGGTADGLYFVLRR